jgi:Na+-translocating ferredoxin:NAD+ oxidoreductase subunit G
MRDMMKMVIVLTVLASFSGGLLASIRNGTKERIEVAQLNFVKGPAIKEIMVGSSNDPIADRFKMNVGETEKWTFLSANLTARPKQLHWKLSAKDMAVMWGLWLLLMWKMTPFSVCR